MQTQYQEKSARHVTKRSVFTWLRSFGVAIVHLAALAIYLRLRSFLVARKSQRHIEFAFLISRWFGGCDASPGPAEIVFELPGKLGSAGRFGRARDQGHRRARMRTRRNNLFARELHDF